MTNYKYRSVLILLALGMVAISSGINCRADLVIAENETVQGSYQISENIINQGVLAGLNSLQRIIVEEGYTVTGSGSLQNVDVLGTYSPGNSPAIINGTNQGFGGTVIIELGGTSPGFGSNNHDQINDSGVLSLGPNSVLSILPFNGFIPSIGDTFTLLTWQSELSGDFNSIEFDPFFANNGVNFRVEVLNPTGAGSLSLVAIPEASTILVWGMLSIICLVTRIYR